MAQAQHCALLWRMYVDLEYSKGTPEAFSRAQGVFYRSLQSCPGTKVLYRDAVAILPDTLQQTLDILVEKELHLRAPLEEVGR